MIADDKLFDNDLSKSLSSIAMHCNCITLHCITLHCVTLHRKVLDEDSSYVMTMVSPGASVGGQRQYHGWDSSNAHAQLVYSSLACLVCIQLFVQYLLLYVGGHRRSLS